MAKNNISARKKERLNNKIKLEGSRVVLSVEDFIDIFSFENENKDIITRIKDIAKNGVTILNKQINNLSWNEIFDKNKTEAVEKAYKIAQKHGIKCRYNSIFHYFNGNTFYPVNKAIDASKMIDSWVKEIESARIKGKKLTPYEKFLYAYEIVTQYEYKFENKADNSGLSRNVIHVLNGDKIVCAGFEAIFRHILNRIDIPCSRIHLDHIDKKPGGHSTCLVYLDDKKYNINGLFVSEPTWGGVKQSNGRNFNYACLSIMQAKELYRVNNLDLSDRTLFNSKQALFASVRPKDELKYRKNKSEERKSHYLINLQKHIIEDEKFFTRASKEIEKIIKEVYNTARDDEEKRLKKMHIEERDNRYKKATLKQKDISKNYKRKRFEYQKQDLIGKLVASTTNKLDDYDRYDKFSEISSVFDDNGKCIIKQLLETKHSEEEIINLYTKKLKEFIQKSDEEKLEIEFKNYMKDVREVSDKVIERITRLREKVVDAQPVEMTKENLKKFKPKLADGLMNVGLAKGMSNLEAKCYTLARMRALNDQQFKRLQSKMEKDEYLAQFSLEVLHNNSFILY